MIKKLFLVVFVALGFVACNNNTKTEAPEVSDAVQTKSEAEILTVDQLQSQIADLVGQVVTVTGDVDHVCKHGGTKMVILGDSTDIHIKATDESGNFRADEVMDHRVVVDGIVDEFVVDDNYIMEQEAKLEELIANGGDEEAVEGEEEHKGKGEEKGMFPDNDSKHNKEVKGLKNQIASLKKMLEEAKAEGKDHVSFYSVKAKDYSIDEDAVVESKAEHFDDSAAEIAEEKESADTTKDQ